MNFLYDRLAKKRAVIVLVVWGIVFLGIAYLNVGKPFGLGQLKEITGGIESLDTVSHSPEKTYQTLEDMGEEGRRFYKQVLLTTELAFPLIYRLFNVVFITFFLARWLPRDSRLRWLCLAPLIGMICDYCENFMVISMINNYPVQALGLAKTVRIFTRIKWFSNYFDYFLMNAAWVGLLISHIAKKRKKKA